MNAKRPPTAPKHLKAATRRWWESVVSEWDLEPHHVRLLTLACESWDRCQAAREVLDRAGMTYTDRLGAPRARPEVAIERDCKVAFARLLRELGLDAADGPTEAPRPNALPGNRR